MNERGPEANNVQESERCAGPPSSIEQDVHECVNIPEDDDDAEDDDDDDWSSIVPAEFRSDALALNDNRVPTRLYQEGFDLDRYDYVSEKLKNYNKVQANIRRDPLAIKHFISTHIDHKRLSNTGSLTLSQILALWKSVCCSVSEFEPLFLIIHLLFSAKYPAGILDELCYSIIGLSSLPKDLLKWNWVTSRRCFVSLFHFLFWSAAYYCAFEQGKTPFWNILHIIFCFMHFGVKYNLWALLIALYLCFNKKIT